MSGFHLLPEKKMFDYKCVVWKGNFWFLVNYVGNIDYLIINIIIKENANYNI